MGVAHQENGRQAMDAGSIVIQLREGSMGVMCPTPAAKRPTRLPAGGRGFRGNAIARSCASAQPTRSTPAPNRTRRRVFRRSPHTVDCVIASLPSERSTRLTVEALGTTSFFFTQTGSTLASTLQRSQPATLESQVVKAGAHDPGARQVKGEIRVEVVDCDRMRSVIESAVAACVPDVVVNKRAPICTPTVAIRVAAA
jgi:hypothetical protein